MASKVLIKIPVPFNGQMVKKGAPDVIRAEPTNLNNSTPDPLLRVTQLEQNIRFLQEQHQLMLSSLHEEIELLRQKNRDLQFQLIFGKANTPVTSSSSDSSPEDIKHKTVLSPKEINTRPLQVEMLEREVAELKVELAHANKNNESLTQTVEEQKKELEECGKDKLEEYIVRLEESDNLVKRLIRENEEQRKEMASLKNQTADLGQHSGQNRYNGRRGGDQQRFPPLQPHHHSRGWHRHRSSDYQGGGGGRGGGGGGQGLVEEVVGQAAPSLPHITRTYSQPSGRPRYYRNNGHHYYHNHNSTEDRDSRRGHRGGQRSSAPHLPQ